MKLNEFARSILFGTTLEDKLVRPASGEEWVSDDRPALIEVPSFPGRPEKLAKKGRSEFPSESELGQESARGRILHFFANHELLAMELMALVLLRFPEAPEAFRLGIARTILEEQDHMRLYIDRMRELGIDFGDIPVNDYFWNCMKEMRTPLDFVTQMSLTFEQANLDYSLQYRDAVARAGDEATAAILDRVYREEIGHVKNGLVWFNRWREDPSKESEWDAYIRLLPLPLTPRRAKGNLFSVEARRAAGFSDDYIRQVELAAGSRGRPPVLWHYNPHVDAEIARGKPGTTPSAMVQRVSADLEALPLFLAHREDAVLLSTKPSTDWLETLREAGYALPEFVTRVSEIRDRKLGGISPWAWSPSSFDQFRPLRQRIVESPGTKWVRELLEKDRFESTGFSELFSKAWSARFLRKWILSNPGVERVLAPADTVAIEFSNWEEAKAHALAGLARGEKLMAKAPYGTSGGQVKKLLSASELDGPLGGWIRGVIETQGLILLEPLLDKIADLSIQLEVTESGVRLLEARRFITGSRLEYRGTWLGGGVAGFESDQLRFLHDRAAHPGGSAMQLWFALARELGQELQRRGYRGPAGIDALLYRREDRALALKPLVELNPRWTMGRVALEIEKAIAPGTEALWFFLPLRAISERGYESALKFTEECRSRHPIGRSSSGLVASGIVCTNDPSTAREVLSALFVGEDAVNFALSFA